MTTFSSLMGGGGGSNFNEFNHVFDNRIEYSSDDTFTVPSGVQTVYVTLTGGGGGGSQGDFPDGGGGGGGGETIVRYRVEVAPGDSIPVTIGAGGAGDTTGYSNGDPGGDTSFGSHLTANGGYGGQSQRTGGHSQPICLSDVIDLYYQGGDPRMYDYERGLYVIPGGGGGNGWGATNATEGQRIWKYSGGRVWSHEIYGGGGGASALGPGGNGAQERYFAGDSAGANTGAGGGGGSPDDKGGNGGSGYLVVEWDNV